MCSIRNVDYWWGGGKPNCLNFPFFGQSSLLYLLGSNSSAIYIRLLLMDLAKLFSLRSWNDKLSLSFIRNTTASCLLNWLKLSQCNSVMFRDVLDLGVRLNNSWLHSCWLSKFVSLFVYQELIFWLKFPPGFLILWEFLIQVDPF